MTKKTSVISTNSINRRHALILGTAGAVIPFGLPALALTKAEAESLINTITKEEIDALAQKHLKDENFYILVVGDGASNRSKLEKLGYEVVELDAKGDVIEETQLEVDK